MMDVNESVFLLGETNVTDINILIRSLFAYGIAATVEILVLYILLFACCCCCLSYRKRRNIAITKDYAKIENVQLKDITENETKPDYAATNYMYDEIVMTHDKQAPPSPVAPPPPLAPPPPSTSLIPVSVQTSSASSPASEMTLTKNVSYTYAVVDKSKKPAPNDSPPNDKSPAHSVNVSFSSNTMSTTNMYDIVQPSSVSKNTTTVDPQYDSIN
jgi:hypothetical protein